MAKANKSTPAQELSDAGRDFHRRGWVLGTIGSFSALVARKPMRLWITAGGNENGILDETQFLELDDDAEILQGFGTPSTETLLHLAIYRILPRARAILHSHSIWGTILSDACFEQGAIEISGFEMLKGLPGIETHEHIERVPVIQNSQDYVALSHVIDTVIRENKDLHGIYLRRHGLYTWGETVAEAKRNVEIFEFLFEVLGRQAR